MGLRGASKIPAEIAKQRGYYRPYSHKDEIADDTALTFIHNGFPLPPEGLDDLAKQVWNVTLGEASKAYGYISFIDLVLFEEYCLCYSELKTLNNLCRGNKINYKDDRGVIRINPLFDKRDDKRRMLIRLSREFGFSPSARTSIKLAANPNKQSVDEFADGL